MTVTTLTKKMRSLFAKNYGKQTAAVVSRIARGWTTDRIVRNLDLRTETVAAYRANVTRNTYLPFVKGDVNNGFTGTCRF